jgi:hypothetical protein
MNPPSRSSARLRRRIAAAVLVGLALGATPAARGAGEPGPVPLLQDAAPAETGRPVPPPAAGLGDWRLVAALAVTFAVLVGARMNLARRAPQPPPDVFEVLGTASLGGQHAVRIVRFGPKTLLVGVSAAGSQTLAEIADPQATACIAAACRDVRRPPERPARRVAAPGRESAAREVA